MAALDVLDLPQLYTRPPAKALVDALALLAAAPPSWDDDTPARDVAVAVAPHGVAAYLTGIVASPLLWIDDDDARERIWTQASLRLSERAGRTAMGDLSRRFRVPARAPAAPFELAMHEPALTGDDLGLKTWAASYLLAKRLPSLPLPARDSAPPPRVLELGAGTGLVGLAMACSGFDVVLTDLAAIVPNLCRNARDNAPLVRERGGSATCGILDWTAPSTCHILADLDLGEDEDEDENEPSTVMLQGTFPIILAADSLYSAEHPRWLVDTIAVWLAADQSARVVVEFPLRDAYLPEVADFRSRMAAIGLHVLDEGEEKGLDDWGRTGTDHDGDEGALVTCWWSCWGRQSHQVA